MKLDLADVEIRAEYFPGNEIALVLAGGRAPNRVWLQNIYSKLQPKLYCADGGIKSAEAIGLVPELLLGDADSADFSSYQRAEAHGTVIKRYPVAKDNTDLGLVLANVPDIASLLLSGVFGGRLDHLYANIFTILAKKKAFQPCIMADEQELLLLLQENESVSVKMIRSPKAISLLCLEDEATVSLEGVRWPLVKADISRTNAGYTVSNELGTDKKIDCTCHHGTIGLYIYFENE